MVVIASLAKPNSMTCITLRRLARKFRFSLPRANRETTLEENTNEPAPTSMRDTPYVSVLPKRRGKRVKSTAKIATTVIIASVNLYSVSASSQVNAALLARLPSAGRALQAQYKKQPPATAQATAKAFVTANMLAKVAKASIAVSVPTKSVVFVDVDAHDLHRSRTVTHAHAATRTTNTTALTSPYDVPGLSLTNATLASPCRIETPRP
mmetsp:Transcript_6263/g.25000  ORF Transcript_6263/g.25000 Transcript_6263/m.25000 type:complete len:209 (-) Transcript_6263:30-656(-)